MRCLGNLNWWNVLLKICPFTYCNHVIDALGFMYFKFQSHYLPLLSFWDGKSPYFTDGKVGLGTEVGLDMKLKSDVSDHLSIHHCLHETRAGACALVILKLFPPLVYLGDSQIIKKLFFWLGGIQSDRKDMDGGRGSRWDASWGGNGVGRCQSREAMT